MIFLSLLFFYWRARREHALMHKWIVTFPIYWNWGCKDLLCDKHCAIIFFLTRLAGRDGCDALRDLVPLYNLKNVKNTHGGFLLLVKLQAKARNFTKSSTPLWVFFTFFKLCKRYQIGQSITNILAHTEMTSYLLSEIRNSVRALSKELFQKHYKYFVKLIGYLYIYYKGYQD